MKSLNTYNYHETTYMKPLSYKVTISDNDKVIKIEEDGDLIAVLSFALENNTLFLNGKDGLEVAQIELPVAMTQITNQKYDPDTKSIDLTIQQTNGKEVTFSLDVEELVNVYTAGDGIDINENVISIKIKDDSGTLTVDEEGLDINIESLASSGDIADIRDSIVDLQEKDKKIEQDILDLKSQDEDINKKIEIINGQIGNLNENGNSFTDEIVKLQKKDEEILAEISSLKTIDNYIKEEIENLKDKNHELKSKLDVEKISRENADEEIRQLISDEQNRAESSENEIKETILKLGDSHTKDINDLNIRVNDSMAKISSVEVNRILKDTELEEEISKIKTKDLEQDSKLSELQNSNEDILNKIGNIENQDGSIADEIDKLHKKDEEILGIIDSINGNNGNSSAEIEKLKQKDIELESSISTLSDSVSKANDKVTALESEINDEARIREENDNNILISITKETKERKEADMALEEKVTNEYTELVNTVKLVKDPLNSLHYTLMVNDAIKGDINIPADKMLESVTFDEETNELVFSWNTSAQQEPTRINISNLADDYKAGEGLSLSVLDGNKVFSIPLSNSKYISFNKENQLELDVKIVKPEGSKWKYVFNDKKGFNNGNIIDFSNEYDELVQSISNTYATISKVEKDLLKAKSEIIGTSDDTKLDNTLFGIRKEIEDTENRIDGKIDVAKNDSISQAKVYADKVSRDTLVSSKEYTDTSIANTKKGFSDEIKKLKEKDIELGNTISNNSTKITKLSTGLDSEKYTGGTGVFDELHRLFHELTEGLDENFLKGKIKAIEDKLNSLEQLLGNITGGIEIENSIANLIDKALKEAKDYTDKAKTEAIESAALSAERLYQVKGNYISQEYLDGKNYIDRDSLLAMNYANKDYVDNKVSVFITSADVAEKYQPKGNYITSIPDEFVTEQELLNKGYARKEYVDLQDTKALGRDEAISIYQPKGNYLVAEDLNKYNFADKIYVNDKTNDMLTKTEANLTYQKKGNYLTEIPMEYVTEIELDSKNFVNMGELNSRGYATTTEVNAKTHDMLTRAEAHTIYQPIGNYVTDVNLEAKRYATLENLETKTRDMATQSWVTLHFVGNNEKYVTEKELAEKNYTTMQEVENKKYINETVFNTTLESYLPKQTAEEIYATKAELDNAILGAMSPTDLLEGDNVKIDLTQTPDGKRKQAKLSVRLSDKFMVNDEFNQNLPVRNENLDEVTKKLSEAIKGLHDTTDGEVF